jgi:hypothetical protein
MVKALIGLLAGASLVIAGTAGAADQRNLTASDTYKVEKERIAAHYKADADRCKALSGNANDICIKEAKGREKVARAELEASYKNTDKARFEARVARADADYDVAKEKCDDLSGNPKDVCLKQAKAGHTRAVADAKVARVSREQAEKANAKTDDQRRDAAKETRDADYQVARAKCDTLAGPTKDRCLDDAKARYGMK